MEGIVSGISVLPYILHHVSFHFSFSHKPPFPISLYTSSYLSSLTIFPFLPSFLKTPDQSLLVPLMFSSYCLISHPYHLCSFSSSASSSSLISALTNKHPNRSCYLSPLVIMCLFLSVPCHFSLFLCSLSSSSLLLPFFVRVSISSPPSNPSILVSSLLVTEFFPFTLSPCLPFSSLPAISSLFHFFFF